jgi:microcystin-dependent protein
MSDQYVGEIRMFGGRFAPQGWFLCDGSRIPISEFEMLFTLIGTTYGGDGQSTFSVPDLRGRVPVGQGTFQGMTYVIGEQGGVETVTLTKAQMPNHNHPFFGSVDTAASSTPNNAVPASLSVAAGSHAYGTDVPYREIETHTVEPVGENGLHTNIQPYLAVNFIIAWDGVYPPPGAAGEELKEATDE